jgi:hypothetical protein
MLTGASGAMVKETKNIKLKIENNIFYTFEELTAQASMSYYYICFLKQCPAAPFSIFHDLFMRSYNE